MTPSTLSDQFPQQYPPKGPADPSRGINLPPVRVHDLDASSKEIDRRLKHLLNLNHIDNGVLFSHYRFHNHVPHSLGCVYLLGGSVEQLEQVYADIIDRGARGEWTQPEIAISGENYRQYLGEPRHQRAFLDFFGSELSNHDGWKALTNKYLFERGVRDSPNEYPIFNCIVAGLCHSLIHLAYAYELDSKEIALEALSLASSIYNPTLAGLVESSPDIEEDRKINTTTDVAELIQRCHDDQRLDGAFDETGMQNLAVLLSDSALCQILSEYFWSYKVENPGRQFEQAQKYVARLFLSGAPTVGGAGFDFFLLHMLTGFHAARVVIPFLDTSYHIPLLKQWFLHTLAFYIIQLRPLVADTVVTDFEIDDKDWPWVVNEALNGKHRFDVHVVKALRALKEAATFCKDPDDYYLKAAVKFATEYSDWTGFGASFDGDEDAEAARQVRQNQNTARGIGGEAPAHHN